jgi:hypothetical protein
MSTTLADEGAIVLVSATDFLLELIVTRIHLAFEARLGSDQPRRPALLVIDESQQVKAPSLARMFSESRKMGLGLLLLTQLLDNWDEQLLKSILGNVGTLVSFTLGPDDARKLAPVLRLFSAEDLMDLDKYEAVVKIRVGGNSVPAFDIRTHKIVAEPDENAAAQIRLQTGRRFATPRAQVEASLERDEAPPPRYEEIEED